MIGMNFRQERFEIVTHTSKIGCNGFKANVTALKGDIITEGFKGRVNQEMMQLAESEIRISCRGVCIGGCVVNIHSKKNGVPMNEMLHCPSKPYRLPG